MAFRQQESDARHERDKQQETAKHDQRPLDHRARLLRQASAKPVNPRTTSLSWRLDNRASTARRRAASSTEDALTTSTPLGVSRMPTCRRSPPPARDFET